MTGFRRKIFVVTYLVLCGEIMNCGACKEKDCYKIGNDCTGMRKEILEKYEDDPASRKMMEVATALESDEYMLITRVEEVA